MNKDCKLCGGTFDFRKVYVSKCFTETNIAFPGNLLQVNKDNCFKFCPVCGEKLSRENFNGNDVLEEDILEEILKDKFQAYAQYHNDIKSVYFKGNELILVIDSFLDYRTPQHYDFCFSVLDKHNEIEDFKIFDVEEFETIKDEYFQYSKIYKREGNE